MRTDDIMSVITNAIEETILKEWKHEGYIGGNSNVHSNFEIDRREYVVLIREIGEGEHFSEFYITKECDTE